MSILREKDILLIEFDIHKKSALVIELNKSFMRIFRC